MLFISVCSDLNSHVVCRLFYLCLIRIMCMTIRLCRLTCCSGVCRHNAPWPVAERRGELPAAAVCLWWLWRTGQNPNTSPGQPPVYPLVLEPAAPSDPYRQRGTERERNRWRQDKVSVTCSGLRVTEMHIWVLFIRWHTVRVGSCEVGGSSTL